MSEPRTTGALCKGAWALGSACGHCQRCRDTMQDAVVAIRKLSARPIPSAPEWQALYEHHKRREAEAASKADYANASDHKNRADAIARFISPTDEWERAWSGQQ